MEAFHNSLEHQVEWAARITGKLGLQLSHGVLEGLLQRAVELEYPISSSFRFESGSDLHLSSVKPFIQLLEFSPEGVEALGSG